MENNENQNRQRRVTMKDVAKAAGVSQTTVSFVVNDLDAGLPECTKRKVLDVCAKLNYSPNEAARRLARKASRAIGLAMYDITAVANYRLAASAVLSSVYRAAETRQQRLQIYTTHERREDGSDIGTYFAVPVRGREVEGVIIWDSYVDDKRVISAYNEGLPMITLDRQCGSVPSVIPDYAGGFRQVAALLAEKGYDRICVATRTGSYYRDISARGPFVEAVMELGLPADEITSIEVDIVSQTSPAEMLAKVDELLAMSRRPRVLVCMYDVIAIGAISALRHRGVRVPEDIAVVGCAGVTASADPAYDLTTLHLRHDLMGEHAVDMLLRMVDGDDLTGSSVVVQPQLIVRSSTG